jgi:hypothetical protein
MSNRRKIGELSMQLSLLGVSALNFYFRKEWGKSTFLCQMLEFYIISSNEN